MSHRNGAMGLTESIAETAPMRAPTRRNAMPGRSGGCATGTVAAAALMSFRFLRWGACRYTELMDDSPLRDIQRLVGLSETDATLLRRLKPHATPLLDEVVDRFYEKVLTDPTARDVLSGGEPQLEHLRRTLRQWLTELFEARFDESYFSHRLRIGQAHVRVNLPQHLMIVGIEVIWNELERRLRATTVEGLEPKLQALRKLLMLELIVMLESYKTHYTQKIRRSERSAAEEKLTRTAHLAEIGQLAASLAHEIKNPLAGISGAIQILRDDMPTDDPHKPILQEVLSQISRLDATVKDLLQYARPTPANVQRTSLHDVVTRVLTILREEPDIQRVNVVYERDAANCDVIADEAQIEQLLINLLLNAAHASHDGGEVTLGIQDNQSHLRLILRDRGKGMTEETLQRAFEPFFTTKAKGTGLGLSICRRIAEVNGGQIRIESKPGAGTIVVVELPRGATEREDGKNG